MSADQLVQQLEAVDPPVVLDVRSGVEYGRGHIPGAVHVPFWRVPWAVGTLAADREGPVVVTCEHGPRAALAVAVLKLAGFRDVRYLSGQMSRWKRRQLPLEAP